MSETRNGTDILYANIIDSVGDGVIALDAAGKVTLMNPAAEEITGVSRRLAQGNLFAGVFKGEQLLIEMVEKTATTGMTISDHENVVLKKPGHATPVSATTTDDAAVTITATTASGCHSTASAVAASSTTPSMVRARRPASGAPADADQKPANAVATTIVTMRGLVSSR